MRLRVAIVLAAVLVSKLAWGQSSGIPSTGSPACTRENGCSFAPCYPAALPGGAVAHYFCDCKTTGAAGDQPQSGCSAGSDGADGLTPATAKQTYNAWESIYSGLNADDRILLCNGGAFDDTGAGSNRFVNRNQTATHPIVVGTYPAAWGGGGVRPIVNNALGTYAVNFDDGSDISRSGGTWAGINWVGLGRPATACASSSGIPMEAFFAYNQVNDVLICDSLIDWQCIGMEIAGGNSGTDDNQRITIRNSAIYNNDAQGVLGSGSFFLMDRFFMDYNGKAAANLDHNIYYSSGLSTGAVISNGELYRAAPVGGGGCAGVSLVIHGILDGLTMRGLWIHEPVGTAGSGCYGIGIMPGYTTGEQFNHVTVDGNYLQNMGGSGVEVVACHNCNITNNIMVGAPASGFEAVTVTNDSVGTGDWTNDTILVAGNTAYGNGVQFRETNGTGSADPTRITFANNAVWQTASGTVNCFDHSLANGDYTAMNGNWCYAPSGSTVNWNATGSQSLATWRGNGWDLNSTYGTSPGFTGVTLTATMATVAAAFLPTGISGLVSAGQTALGPTADFAGLTRPQRSVLTIGALELPGATFNPTGPGHPWRLGIWVCALLAIGLSLWSLRARQARRIEAMEDHQHLIDEHTTAALAEMGDDGLGLTINTLCKDCGEPLFLPRNNNSKRRT